MPVDLYVGGAEHATLHLLYARFWHQVLFDLGLVSTPEPFQKLFNQGMIHAASFRDEQGAWYYQSRLRGRAMLVRKRDWRAGRDPADEDVQVSLQCRQPRRYV